MDLLGSHSHEHLRERQLRPFESNISQNSKSIHVRNMINVRPVASNVVIQIQCQANRTIKRGPLGIQTHGVTNLRT